VRRVSYVCVLVCVFRVRVCRVSCVVCVCVCRVCVCVSEQVGSHTNKHLNANSTSLGRGGTPLPVRLQGLEPWV